MYYESELNFFCRILKNFRIQTTIVRQDTEEIPSFDQGLRQMIYEAIDYKELFHSVSLRDTSNTIFRIQDEFLCSYICLRFPDSEEPASYLIVGPYTTQDITQQLLLNLADRFSLSPQQFAQLNRYYADLPLVTVEDTLFSLVTTLGETLWGSMDNFTVEYIDHRISDRVEPVAARTNQETSEDPFLTMQVLESRYAAENQLMHAVSQGLIHKAETAIMNNHMIQLESRVTDPVRNMKNYCIILNTLLRKAAEQGSVHPLHIDSLSSRYARKIEQLTTPEAGLSLQREMVHKYCLLVKNHSMKGYSLLVQKVLTRIDSDLTEDLSLKTQAKLLNVNASYLSSLFKKETGMTLTDYVNRKRVENAVFLLNSTNMQIQGIAQFCGIPDVNYFTKIFKKNIGKTPKEYRGEIS